MFTEKCFIRKNTKELQDKLSDLGYASYHDSERSSDGTYYGIDCGDNEKLFLAIAALRDDSDKDQLFFNNGDTDCKYPIECIHDEFHMFSIDPDTCECIDHTDEYHKGTPNELQKHFKINR